ncbi:MAG: glycosyltransferase family 2 protein [Planctomycetota bacterium]
MSLRRPTFCIVTPSFNQAAFLEQTIQSVLNQDGLGSEFELQYAIADGGSTDGSVEIIRRYEDKLAFWCSEPDRGQSHAINKGFAHLRGDVYAYLNSDDYYLPGAFRNIARSVALNPQADLHHGVCQRVGVRGEVIGLQQSDITSYAEILDLWNHWLRPRPNRNFIQPEVFWTRKWADQIGRFNERLFYTMDYEYWLRGLQAGLEVAAIDNPLASFRLHDAQKTTAKNASILELVGHVERHLDFDDPRISQSQRRRMRRHLELTRRTIETSDQRPEQRVVSLLSLAKDEPALLASRHYWKTLRRSGKRVFWKRSAA